MSVLTLPRWMQPAPDSVVARRLREGKSPYFDAIHLLWSSWLFITPLFDDAGYTVRWMVLTLLSYPLFLWLFAMTLLVSRRHTVWFAAGMAVLCLALLPDYPSGLSYFVYACVMLRRCEARNSPGFGARVLRYAGWLLLLNVAFIVEVWWIGYPWQMMVYIPVTTFVIGIIVNFERVSEEKDVALRMSQEEVRRIAATAERERIGRDLHDLLGHTLSLITLKLELSRKLIDRDVEACRRELSEAESVARKALAEVRSAVTGIRATDLAAELAAARLLLETSDVRLECGELPCDLPHEIEAGLALVLREAVTNIARHAEASSACVSIERADTWLKVGISDDGRGGVHADGNGLRGMRERVRALGGRVHIDSPRGLGTRLQIDVPLSAPNMAVSRELAAATRLNGELGSSAA